MITKKTTAVNDHDDDRVTITRELLTTLRLAASGMLDAPGELEDAAFVESVLSLLSEELQRMFFEVNGGRGGGALAERLLRLHASARAALLILRTQHEAERSRRADVAESAVAS